MTDETNTRTGKRGPYQSSHPDLLPGYPTLKVMCEAHGVRQMTFWGRRKRGWTVRQALGLDPAPHAHHPDLLPGYQTMKAMLAGHGINQTTFNYRRRRGWTVREALGLDPAPIYVRVTNHPDLLPGYSNMTEMRAAHGICLGTYYSRRKAGWTVRQALELDPKPHRRARRASVRVIDHPDLLGGYPSIIAMCEAHGVCQATFAQRRKKGWTVQQALGLDPDFLADLLPGYPSIKAMCKAYGVHQIVYQGRRTEGWTVREALGLDPKEGQS